MGILQHLEELRKRFQSVFLVFIIVFVMTLAFDIRVADVGGVPVPYPFPDMYNSIASKVFRVALEHVQPLNVTAVVFNPFDAALVQIKVAFMLAIALTVPTAAYQFGMFVRPALRPRERKIILRIVAPSVTLFILGMLVAYYVILPPTFEFLYSLADALGVQQKFLAIDQLVDFLLIFTIAFGLAFQLPVVMWALAAAGMVSPDFWQRHWRIAVLAIFVFGAFITPDGTGVTMMMVALPMLGLFVIGLAAARAAWRRREGPEEKPLEGGPPT